MAVCLLRFSRSTGLCHGGGRLLPPAAPLGRGTAGHSWHVGVAPVGGLVMQDPQDRGTPLPQSLLLGGVGVLGHGLGCLVQTGSKE